MLPTDTGKKTGKGAGRTIARSAEVNPSWSGRVFQPNVPKIKAKRTVSTAKTLPFTVLCPFYSGTALCPSFKLPAASAVLRILDVD